MLLAAASLACVMAASAAAQGAPLSAGAAQPLLVLEQHRATVVERILTDWADEFATLPPERRITRQALAEALWQLRSDRLLAASLAGSVPALEAMLAASRDDHAAISKTNAKALGNAAQDLTFTPLNPCRILDTRVVGGALLPGAQRTFDGYSSNFSTQGGTAFNCGIPSGVAALAMNVYAVNPTNTGYIKVWAANAPELSVSTVNYQLGLVAIATGAIVPVDSANSNRFIAKSTAQSDFVADVVGYFKTPLGVDGALELYVSSGRALRIAPNAKSPNMIGGNAANSATFVAYGATIGGGGAAGTSVIIGGFPVACGTACANIVDGNFSTVGGGLANQAGYGAFGPLEYNVATVAGGFRNIATGGASTIGGGEINSATGNDATIAGGRSNTASNYQATVGGGMSNTASGVQGTIGGGYGGEASGGFSTIPGGTSNVASGDYSFAAGRRAKTQSGGPTPVPHAGTFVWADSNDVDFTTVAANEFAVRSTGGARIVTAVDGGGAPSAGVYVSAGGGAWASLSDRAAKEDFMPVDTADMLARVARMPLFSWRYRAEGSGARHLGPTAQDFRASFGLGDSDKSIVTVDADGVALAAIQGLNAKVEEQRRELAELHERLVAAESLRAELASVKAALVELLRSRRVVAAK